MRALVTLMIAAACGANAPISSQPSTDPGLAKRPVVRPDEPTATKAWTDKLRDPREAEHALTELEQLGDPRAIEGIGAAWLEQGRPPRLLQVMIGLARPLTPAEAKAKLLVGYEETGRPASWERALPFLVRAVTEVDAANPHSVDSATQAADGLGEAKLGLDALIDLANKAPSKKLLVAQISAIRAIGAFEREPVAAAAALGALVGRTGPPHPRTATTLEQGRVLEEDYAIYLARTGAATNSIAQLRTDKATKALVLAMYRTPELFTQIRRALVASGPSAVPELRAALRGTNAEVTALFKAQRLDQYCGDKGDATCQPVSAREFYPAIVLGDLRDPASVPDLLEVLKSPGLPVYYADDQPSPMTQHAGAIDALRRLGAPAAAAPLLALWRAPRSDLALRALAMSAYPFAARDTAGLDELAKIASDNAADDVLRQEAATAYARLAHDPKDIGVLAALAQRYLDASAKQATAAAKKTREVAAADKRLDKAKAAAEQAKTALLVATHDTRKTAAEIRAATDAAKRAEEALKVAKKTHRDQVAPFKALEQAATAYRGFARMFQNHIARVEIAVRCKTDASCFAAALTTTPDDAVAHSAAFLKDLASWTPEDKRALAGAAIDRAMLELGKQGAKAAASTDALLAAAGSDDRLVRQAILLALPRIAPLPCGACEAKLDAVIRAGEGKTTLGDLDVETAIVRNYFRWAGGAARP